MNFNSLSYLLFLPLVFLAFYLIAERWRWLVLLIASYGFYATFHAPYLLAVLLAVTSVGYWCGLRIARQQEETARRRWLWLGSGTCVAILAGLKYFPFLQERASSIWGLGSALSATLVTIGVSYFTFQAISYLADVYLEIEDPEPHFGRFALYMAFFPKLLQGPIERAGDLLPQLRNPSRPDYDAIRSGLLLFAWGLFKKVVVADRLALYANQVYNNVHSYSGLALMIGTYAYAFQLYFDFSGYTDMARGTGRLFGITLTENFNSPYLSTSIADFWRRWHISFSRWILDYIFKPLQLGWRSWGQAGTAVALLVTFLISGIWHGAAWGFVIWGAIHGLYLAASTLYRPLQKRIHAKVAGKGSRPLTWWRIFATFNMVCFAWIFFRANSLSDAAYVVAHLFDFRELAQAVASGRASAYFKDITYLDQGRNNLNMVVITTLFLVIVKLVPGNQPLSSRPLIARWLCYCGLVLSIVYFGSFGGANFVYFKF